MPEPLALALPRLPAAIPRSGVSPEARTALRQLLGDGGRQLADAFRAAADVDDLTRARADAVERIVAHVWNACVGEADAVALFAVGGFGRRELFPHSDADLLVLSTQATNGPLRRALESFFACLWDIGLKPGHAVRTIAECRDQAAGDASVYTNLFDARRIAGGAGSEAALAALFADGEIWPKDRYLAARRADRDARHARFDDTAYSLEPNIKDGPGGLRAVHVIVWLGRRLFAAQALSALMQRGLVSASEMANLEAARRLLSRIRFALHLAAGRAEERLLFDYQRMLATRFGFADAAQGNLAVEQFMQGYYRAAITLERLSGRFLDACAEALETTAPTQRLSLDFVNRNGRLDADAPDLFARRPAALIELFRIWGEHPEVASLHTGLVRRIDAALESACTPLADDADVNTAFLRLLRRGAPAVEALARMNRFGVLAHYLPAFGRIVGRMQYDLFHVYTVDEHTIRVLRIIERFGLADTCREFAHAHEVWTRLPKSELLLLAALLHDIAKGRGGDHSELGEAEAREFCTRLKLPDDDVERVAWLVRRHLLMSVTAQRQDITDADVVRRFAGEVGDRERLDQLYLLTCADIAGTSAKLWNSWKDKLLADLYVSTRFALRAGLEHLPHAGERMAGCRRQARELLLSAGVDAAAIERVWADFPDESFLRFSPAHVAWQTRGIAGATVPGPHVLVEATGTRGGSDVFVHAADRDGLFAAITAVFDRQRLSVMEARVITSRSGMSLDSFVVLDGEGKPLRDAAQAARLQRALMQALSQSPYRVEPAAPAPSRAQRHFPIAPRIEFGAQPVRGRSQLAIVCADRPGLLAAIARVFRACRMRVHDARIATFGERAEDFFLISDEHDAILDEAARDGLRVALASVLEPLSNGKRHA
ncbi:MAG: [protein-PII] uridylyltransferase [Proteobacteria bacterium]|nr:[protein-PII] uridylyltransferase [Pseudomonadota bacterium]